MTREELIRQRAFELGQKYFPNANNIWARCNIEAQYVSQACLEMADWIDKNPKEGLVNIDKVRKLLQEAVYDRYIEFHEDYIEDFCKELEE